MSYLVDTNVLVRLLQRSDPMHSDAQRAFLILKGQGEKLCITPQNLIEFWAVATRPTTSNGLELTIDEAVRAIRRLKRFFTLCADTLEIFMEWEKLVVKYQVMGKKAHDTRLVAAMITHEISHLLTFNTEDFNRFTEITVIAPQIL